MVKQYKGKIDYREGETFYFICGGAYWDWPWWKRVLSTIFYRPYGWYRMERGRFQWKYVPADAAPRTVMGFESWLETIRGMSHSHVRPIWFELKQGQP